MLTLVKGKILNKKIMNLCLILGIVMFILVAAATPMFEAGSLKRLLRSSFDNYISVNNEEPFVLSRTEKMVFASPVNPKDLVAVSEDYISLWEKYLKADESGRQIIVSAHEASYKRQFGTNSGYVGIEYIPDFSEKITILAGENALVSSEMACIISEKVYDDENLTLGEEINFPSIQNELGEPLRLKITGIYKLTDENDVSNLRNTEGMRGTVMVSDKTFATMCSDYGVRDITFASYVAMDYKNVSCENVDSIISCLNTYIEKDPLFVTNVMTTLNSFVKERSEIKIISRVLQFPVFVLLLFFIYMVTGQLIGSESGEIAILKSRGYTSLRIVGAYLLQAFIIGMVSLAVALPLSYELCHLVASADGFMSFMPRNLEDYRFEPLMVAYAFGAMLVGILVILIPVIRYAGGNIVNARNGKITGMKKSFIFRFYIDFILTAVFGYLAYNYNRQKQILADSVVKGEGIDAMIFLSVALLILALALLAIRVIGYIVRIVYSLGKNHWGPNMYASFLELLRSNKKRDFISIFIVFAVAMSIFEANLASTVNTMNERRIEYNDGADVIVKEQWIPERRMDAPTKTMVRVYVEPDYGRFAGLRDEGVKMTRVIRSEAAIAANNNLNTRTELMAVHTKEFGEVANTIGSLNGEHWFNLLNELAKNRDGVLISKNLADSSKYKVGDTFTYAREKELEGKGEGVRQYRTVTIVGIFDSFPGYEKYSYNYDKDMKISESLNNLIITNYAAEVNFMGHTPYEIWMNTQDAFEGAGETDKYEKILTYMKEKLITTEYTKSSAVDIISKKSESVLLITNGLFSLGFLVSVITCLVGMLIYWITSFKEREMIFSVYRAMGMAERSVSGIIINEQIFASVLAWVMGGAIGSLVSFMLVELLSTVYLPYKHNIPLVIIPDYKDMGMLMAVVFAVIMLCIMLLKRLMKHSNMVRAIKMGE